MKIKIIFVFLIHIIFYSKSFSQNIEGKYTRKLDMVLDGKIDKKNDSFGIEITKVKKNQYEAIYWGIKNNSVFQIIKCKKIVSIYQTSNQYQRFYNGKIHKNGNIISGNWFDIRGNSGDFELIKIKNERKY